MLEALNEEKEKMEQDIVEQQQKISSLKEEIEDNSKVVIQLSEQQIQSNVELSAMQEWEA